MVGDEKIGVLPMRFGRGYWKRDRKQVRLWDDGSMAKRSTRIAKRDEFENALKEVEENIRSRREKNPPASAPTENEERDGESGEAELPKRK